MNDTRRMSYIAALVKRIVSVLQIVLIFVVYAAMGAAVGLGVWWILNHVPMIYLPRPVTSLDGFILLGLALTGGFGLMAGICGVMILVRSRRVGS